jgi:hypothetical protein
MLLNLVLGTLVTTVGFWIIWGGAWPGVVAAWALAAGGFLWWKAESVTEIWAWSTLGLGVESVIWPVQRMVQLNGAAETLSDDEMGAILSAVVLGLFSSVFWLSFAYGLFKRAWATSTNAVEHSPPAASSAQSAKRRKSK